MVDLFSKPHRVWLWLLALGLAGGGQGLLALPDPTPWHAGVLFALALPVAALAWGPRALAEPKPAPAPPNPRLWVLPLALLAALGAWLGAANNRFTGWGVACWLASVGLWLVAWRVLDRPTRRVARARPSTFQLVIVLILLAAALFRFWGINTLPPEMTSDHAEKLLDVGDILAGKRPIFLERNTGREPMQFYVTALLAGPLGLGLSHLALKVGTAAISLLTVPLTFLVARRGLGLSRRAALLAMALLALSKWHVEISRVGLRFPYAPFGVALTLLFFFRALRLGERRDWLLAGLAFGVALYGYTPIRIVPLLLALGGGLYLLLEQARGRTGLPWRDALANVLLLPSTTLLVFVPLLRYSVEHPDLFWYRSTTRAVEGVAGNLMTIFGGNVLNAARMFHVRGDEVWVNTLPYDPVLDRVTGALFLLGLAVALWVALRRWRAVEVTLLLALPILLLPSILALGWPNENPSVVRAGGALPVVMILAALPLDAFLSALSRAVAPRPTWQRAGAPALLLLFALLAYLNARVYFGPYAREYDRQSWNSSEVAQAILAHEAQIGGVAHAYVQSWPHWIDTRNVAFNMRHPEWDSVMYNQSYLADDSPYAAEPRLIILHPDDHVTLALLEQVWPGASVERFPSRVPDKSFVIVIRPAYATR